MRTSCMLVLPPPPPQCLNYKVGRFFPLLSEKGLQISHFILTGEAPRTDYPALCGWQAAFLKDLSDLGMS